MSVTWFVRGVLSLWRSPKVLPFVGAVREKDNTLYGMRLLHRGVTIVLKDSYKLVANCLEEFPKVFDCTALY